MLHHCSAILHSSLHCRGVGRVCCWQSDIYSQFYKWRWSCCVFLRLFCLIRFLRHSLRLQDNATCPIYKVELSAAAYQEGETDPGSQTWQCAHFEYGRYYSYVVACYLPKNVPSMSRKCHLRYFLVVLRNIFMWFKLCIENDIWGEIGKLSSIGTCVLKLVWRVYAENIQLNHQPVSG